MPVLRPQLPPADRVLPYLRRLDAARIYSNWGPLVSELEQRLASHLGLPPGGVTSASSGTAALAGAILAVAGRARGARPLALVPAFTFVATASAVELCGYRPYLADIDANTWMLDPARLAHHPDLGRVGLVVPVAPFGRPVPQAPWRAFREATGIPVVIDGAASFDRLAQAPGRFLGDVPVALSFHATKCFSTGEGGGVASTDPALVLRCAQGLNFGFHETREAEVPNLNGKMSEYHAAVGLAELDGWPEKRSALERVAGRYRARLSDVGLAARLVASPDVGASYALFCGADPSHTERLVTVLRSSGIDSRLWYGRGLHHHSYFATAPRDGLEVTDALAPCLLGIPLAPDLAEPALGRVAAALARGMEGM